MRYSWPDSCDLHSSSGLAFGNSLAGALRIAIGAKGLARVEAWTEPSDRRGAGRRQSSAARTATECNLCGTAVGIYSSVSVRELPDLPDAGATARTVCDSDGGGTDASRAGGIGSANHTGALSLSGDDAAFP